MRQKGDRFTLMATLTPLYKTKLLVITILCFVGRNYTCKFTDNVKDRTQTTQLCATQAASAAALVPPRSRAQELRTRERAPSYCVDESSERDVTAR